APRAIAQAEPRVAADLLRLAVDRELAVHAADLDEVREVDERAGLARSLVDSPRVDRRHVALEFEIVGKAGLVVADPEPPALHRLEDLCRKWSRFELRLMHRPFARRAEVPLPAALLDEHAEAVDHARLRVLAHALRKRQIRARRVHVEIEAIEPAVVVRQRL